ncbi:MAG: inositol monophosphatase family protein [Armatimonadota bacterium]
MEFSQTTEFALSVAREATHVVMRILPESRTAKEIRLKTPTDLVTRADYEAERLIAARIRARYPDHALLGEEGTDEAGAGPDSGPGVSDGSPPGPATKPRWLIDPVDGTSNFAHGVPWFAVSIALEEGGVVQCGVVAVPPLGEYFVAERGCGAFLVDRAGGRTRLTASQTVEIGSALVSTGLPREPQRSRHVPTIAPFMVRSLEVRIMGSAAIHLAYIAAGRLDAFWEPGLNPWDVAAGILLVEEAGGRVTDFAGRPLRTLGGQILASNGPLHPAMVGLLSR